MKGNRRWTTSLVPGFWRKFSHWLISNFPLFWRSRIHLIFLFLVVAGTYVYFSLTPQLWLTEINSYWGIEKLNDATGIILTYSLVILIVWLIHLFRSPLTRPSARTIFIAGCLNGIVIFMIYLFTLTPIFPMVNKSTEAYLGDPDILFNIYDFHESSNFFDTLSFREVYEQESVWQIIEKDMKALGYVNIYESEFEIPLRQNPDTILNANFNLQYKKLFREHLTTYDAVLGFTKGRGLYFDTFIRSLPSFALLTFFIGILISFLLATWSVRNRLLKPSISNLGDAEPWIWRPRYILDADRRLLNNDPIAWSTKYHLFLFDFVFYILILAIGITALVTNITGTWFDFTWWLEIDGNFVFVIVPLVFILLWGFHQVRGGVISRNISDQLSIYLYSTIVIALPLFIFAFFGILIEPYDDVGKVLFDIGTLGIALLAIILFLKHLTFREILFFPALAITLLGGISTLFSYANDAELFGDAYITDIIPFSVLWILALIASFIKIIPDKYNKYIYGFMMIALPIMLLSFIDTVSEYPSAIVMGLIILGSWIVLWGVHYLTIKRITSSQLT
ncbi:MAG: hypothetical protein AAF502_10950 [Bacteroidota bacterium]